MRYLFLLFLLVLAGCGGSVPESAATDTAMPVPSEASTATPDIAPSVVIDAPPSNSTFVVGERVVVQSTANDGIGIARVELFVNGAVVRSDEVPEGDPQPRFSLLQPWEPAAAGEYILRVIAYRADGTASEPATIAVAVDEAPAEASGSEPAATPCTVVASTSLNVRLGPGAGYDRRGALGMGESAQITGKLRDGSWWQIAYGSEPAWVAASHGYTDGDCANIEVVAAPDLPGAGGAGHTATPSPTTGGPTATPPVTSTPLRTPTPTPSIAPGGPTLTPSATPTTSRTATPTASPTLAGTTTATATEQATNTPTATATEQATNTPTATATEQATNTPTATATPVAQLAPEDARFNNPLVIPLDNTVSVLDFVSYPGGDREDRVRWDVTGMNANAALSGGRARLVITVSCFGTNTAEIDIFTGGQTFSCGQTIVDREVTFDSRTGSAVITAVGGQGTYVQWVLTGTATRVN